MTIEALLNPQDGRKQGRRASASQPIYGNIRSDISDSDCSSLSILRGEEPLSNADSYYPESEINKCKPRMGQVVNEFMSCILSPIVLSTKPVVKQNSRRSISTLSKSNGGRDDFCRRRPRLRYKEEEMYFVWYLRVDLGREWKDISNIFNLRFPRRKREGVQGIQCGLYRFMQRKMCPSLRQQREIMEKELFATGDGGFASTQFGAIKWASIRYPWMR